jgi:hypothetical protein
LIELLMADLAIPNSSRSNENTQKRGGLDNKNHA